MQTLISTNMYPFSFPFPSELQSDHTQLFTIQFWDILLIVVNLCCVRNGFDFISAFSSLIHPVGLQTDPDCTHSNVAESVGQVTVQVCVNQCM